MGSEFDGRLKFAHFLADAAGKVIRPYFRRRIEIVDKNADKDAFFDPVTKADREAEAALIKLIREEFPDDAILGEEFGDTAGTNDYRWVLDPLDGTRAFISGQPMWGTLIALERAGERVFGILDQPFLRERFVGTRNRTLFYSGEGETELRTRPCAALKEAVISTTHPGAHFDSVDRAIFNSVESNAKLSRYGGDCYAYGLVAMGFIDVVMESNLRHWDFAAIVPIVEGAGGVVSDWDGCPLSDGGSILAAGDSRVHAGALGLIAAARGKKA